MSMKEKLKKISSEEDSNWIEEAEQDLRQARVRRKSWKVALRILALLHEKGLSQTELADRMGVSRQQVTKIVKGKENLTLETIDKLEQALGATLLDVPATASKNVQETMLQTSTTATATSTIAAIPHEALRWEDVYCRLASDILTAVKLVPIEQPDMNPFVYRHLELIKSIRYQFDGQVTCIHASKATVGMISVPVSRGGAAVEVRSKINLCKTA